MAAKRGRPKGSKTDPIKKAEHEPIAKIREERDKYKRYYEEGIRCPVCGKLRLPIYFYVDGRPGMTLRKGTVCKECVEAVAVRRDEHGDHEPTKESIIAALRLMNKPFIDSVWNQAITNSANPNAHQNDANLWAAYMHLISLPQHIDKDFYESDLFKSVDGGFEIVNPEFSEEIKESFEQNKQDAIRLLGYDPFVNELPEDQPTMYANLIGFLDSSGEANEDRNRLFAIIEIIKSFNQIEKMNDTLTKMLRDTRNLEKNMATIKNLEMTKSTMIQATTKLAAENGISMKNNVNSSKGENTWTGKMRKLKEMNLRDQEVNLYDVQYADAMQQVAKLSDAALLAELSLDENDYTEIIKTQRELITELTERADTAEEKVRVLIRENQDLKAR